MPEINMFEYILMMSLLSFCQLGILTNCAGKMYVQKQVTKSTKSSRVYGILFCAILDKVFTRLVIVLLSWRVHGKFHFLLK